MNRLQVDLIIRWYDKTKLLNLSLKKQPAVTILTTSQLLIISFYNYEIKYHFKHR